MICIIQRVKSASVKTENYFQKINHGILILLGVANEDEENDATILANKIINLRIFEDNQEKMNLSLLDIKGEALIISQFTLLADCKKGRRPSFTNSANYKKGKIFYEAFVDEIKKLGVGVKTGLFGAHMEVELINDGPVTIILDSREL